MMKSKNISTLERAAGVIEGACIEQLLGDIRATVELANKGAAEKDAEIERLTKERDLANAEREANVKGFTKQIEEMSVELQAMRNAANAYKKRSEELEKDLTARRLMAEMHRTTVEEVKAEGINAMADKLICFYQNLPGKTVAGSVAFHVECVRSELLKEVLK